MDLPVSDFATDVQYLSSFVTYETSLVCALDENEKLDLTSIRPYSQSCLNCLQATRNGVDEVFVCVVTIYEHLSRTCQKLSDILRCIRRNRPLRCPRTQYSDSHRKRPAGFVNIASE